MAAFTFPHPSSNPCSNIRQAHPPMLAWPCMATRSCHHPIPTLQHPCKHPYFHTHLHANPTPCHLFFSATAYPPSLTPPCARVLFSGWGTGSSQASLPFPTDLAGASFGVRRRCSGSGRLSRLSTAACLLSSSTAPAAWTSICWCRGFESHASPPSRRHHPCPYPQHRCRWRLCLRELPRWMGLPWAVKGLVLMTGLVLPVMALGLGLSWSPGPFTLMNASCQFPLLKWPMLTSS